MRVLVTGSRSWLHAETVHRELAALLAVEFDCPQPRPDFVVVHGDASRGADRIARDWARSYTATWPGIRDEPRRADWERLGKRAGFVRNAEMVALGADVCLAFIRDCSKGATHTARLAKDAGIELHVYRETSP